MKSGNEKTQKIQGDLHFLLSVMNDSVPAMLDAFHLHKLPSHGRYRICLNPGKGFCLDSTKNGIKYYCNVLF